MSKLCTKCDAPGPFYKRTAAKDGLTDWCKACFGKARISWTAKNRDRSREYHAKWRAAHPGAGKAARARHWARHGDRLRAKAAAWNRAHRDKVSVHEARRRARKANVESTLTLAEWREILDVFGHACAYCLRTGVKLEQEHVIAIARGGRHVAENVVPACRSCNAKKHDKMVLAMVNVPVTQRSVATTSSA